VKHARQILRELRRRGSAAQAAVLQRFFKTGPGEYGEGDVFLGVWVPVCRAVAAAHRAATLSDVAALLAAPEHEARLVGLLLLVDRFPRASSREQAPGRSCARRSAATGSPPVAAQAASARAAQSEKSCRRGFHFTRYSKVRPSAAHARFSSSC
jgi:hypothetical protein